VRGAEEAVGETRRRVLCASPGPHLGGREGGPTIRHTRASRPPIAGPATGSRPAGQQGARAWLSASGHPPPMGRREPQLPVERTTNLGMPSFEQGRGEGSRIGGGGRRRVGGGRVVFACHTRFSEEKQVLPICMSGSSFIHTYSDIIVNNRNNIT
jgi:hypothetical protein